MNYAQIVDICCRDLRRYLVDALSSTKGGVISVKMRRLLRVELPPPDRTRYSKCLSSLLHAYRWGDAYVIPRRDAEWLLESLDELCRNAKQQAAERRKPRCPRRRRERLGEEAVLVTVTVTHDLLQAVDEYATRIGTSRSAVVRLAIQRLLEERPEAVDSVACRAPAHVVLRLPASLLRALDQYAKELKTTRSALVRYAVTQMLERIRVTQNVTLVQATP